MITRKTEAMSVDLEMMRAFEEVTMTWLWLPPCSFFSMRAARDSCLWSMCSDFMCVIVCVCVAVPGYACIYYKVVYGLYFCPYTRTWVRLYASGKCHTCVNAIFVVIVREYVCVCVNVCVCGVCVCVRAHACMHACMHIYVRTHDYTQNTCMQELKLITSIWRYSLTWTHLTCLKPHTVHYMPAP
jgi:hypothetical protein